MSMQPNAIDIPSALSLREWLPGATDDRTPSRTDPADRDAFIDAMGAAVTGVNVVTTDGPAGRFGLTVSAMVSLSADPPMVLVCINRRSPVCRAVRDNARFSVNVLTTGQRHLADSFAGRSARGAPYDFATAEWTGEATESPRLSDALAVFDCTLAGARDFGSHTLFVGHVFAVAGGGGTPLLYSDRAYGRPSRWS